MQQIQLKNRLVTVDALRGFALLGIMLAHFIFWYTAGPLPQDVYSRYQDVGSQVAGIFNEIFISGKFFAFFSFLFGLSFYLQMKSAALQHGNFVVRYAWRLTILMAIGVMHHAMWQGDILSIYVPLGFVLLFMRKLNNKWTLIVGVLLALNVPGMLIQAVGLFTSPTPGANFDFAAAGNAYNSVITSGSWATIFRYNLENFDTKFNFQFQSGRIYITLGFFLLGAFAGRKKWFENPDTAKPLFRQVCKKSAAIMGIAFAFALGIFSIDAIAKLGWQQNPIAGYIFSIFYNVFNTSMVAFFISGLTLLMYRRKWQRFFYPMAAVGKMALTSYITQTVFGLLLFYHVGLGLYTKTSPGLNYGIAVLFFVVQVAFSRWYLRHFIYGPLEWLWRSATLLQWQPFLKRAAEEPIIIHTPAEVAMQTAPAEIT